LQIFPSKLALAVSVGVIQFEVHQDLCRQLTSVPTLLYALFA